MKEKIKKIETRLDLVRSLVSALDKNLKDNDYMIGSGSEELLHEALEEYQGQLIALKEELLWRR